MDRANIMGKTSYTALPHTTFNKLLIRKARKKNIFSNTNRTYRVIMYNEYLLINLNNT